jgi:hypothetical protein
MLLSVPLHNSVVAVVVAAAGVVVVFVVDKLSLTHQVTCNS